MAVHEDTRQGARTAVILTSREVEYLAVRPYLDRLEPQAHEGTVYEVGTLRAGQHLWEVAIADLEIGGLAAGVQAERVIAQMNPDLVCFVGLAGGVKEVASGDVVIATKIYGYTADPAGAGFRARPEGVHSSFGLLQWAKVIARESGWLRRVGSFGVAPRAHVAPIAAGERIGVDSREPVAAFLRANYDDAVAVEMEGWGALEVVYTNERPTIVIRGVCGRIDGPVEDEGADWQERAARHAAAYTVELLGVLDLVDSAARRMPSAPTSRTGPDVASFPGARALEREGRHAEAVDFFISYTGADEAWATWVAWELEAAGYKTKIQAWDFRPGSNFVVEMDRAAREAKHTIAILSPAYLDGVYTHAEWAGAFATDPTGTRRTLVPVRVEACDLSGLLAQVVYIDLLGLHESAARHALVEGVRIGRGKPSSAPTFPGTQQPEFPGPPPVSAKMRVSAPSEPLPGDGHAQAAAAGEPEEGAYLNFDLLLEPAEKEGYRAAVLASPAGTAETHFLQPFSEVELENFILRVSHGSRRRGTRGSASPDVETVKLFGQRLFESLFHDDLEQLLQRSMVAAERRDKGLRLRLRLDGAPGLADLPWEFLYERSRNHFLGLSVSTPIIRYLDLPNLGRPLVVQPPLRVLVMISSPTDYPELLVEDEWAKLGQVLGDLERRGLVTLERLERASLDALQRRLRRASYHIFHFIGHGEFDRRSQDGLLVLEDQTGRGRPLRGYELGTLLHDQRSLRLVILNACEGARAAKNDPFVGVAQSLVQQGMVAAVAMQFDITDEAATTFTQEFYGAVADGYPVDASLAEARKAMFAQGHEVEWATPVLYTRSAEGRVFDIGPQAAAKPPERRSIDAFLARRLLPVDAGVTTTLKLMVRNVGTVRETVRLRMSGGSADWISVSPATVTLAPGQEQVALVRFDPPALARPDAGPRRFAVEVVAGDDPTIAALAEGTVEVRAVDPEPLRGAEATLAARAAATHGGLAPPQVIARRTDGRRMGPWLLATTALLGLAAVVVLAAIFVRDRGPMARPGSVQATVPKVAGMTLSVAVDSLRRAGFTVRTVWEPGPSTPKGKAVRTEPAGGAATQSGATITLHASSGTIAFSPTAGDQRGIYTVGEDGKPPVLLIQSLQQGERNLYPAWSPDGSRIAFVRITPGSDRPDLYVSNADGTQPVNLTPDLPRDPRYLAYPTWSHDGARIAFVARFVAADSEGCDAYSTIGDLFVMNSDGSNPTQLTDGGCDTRPAWSPVDNRIAFTRIPPSPGSGNYDLYLVDAADPAKLEQLTNDPDIQNGVTWSPDGSRIAFVQERPAALKQDESDGALDVWIMNVDGTGRPTNLTKQLPGGGVEPAWSPDGSRIAFGCRRPDHDGDTHIGDICTIGIDGSNRRHLTASLSDGLPDTTEGGPGRLAW
jgi:Tol biopolymer transport system component/nucleoside phosphorylase